MTVKRCIVRNGYEITLKCDLLLVTILMLVLVEKLDPAKKRFLVPSCLGHNCTGLRENGHGPVNKRGF